MKLYLYQNGEQLGPYAEQEITAMLTSAAITPDDLVWHEGLPDWLPVRSVIGIAEPIAATSQEPAPASPERRPADKPKRHLKVAATIACGAVLSLLLLGYLIWPRNTAHIEGYFDMTQVGAPKNTPCVWAFAPDGYVTVYSFVDQQNFLLLDGTCRLGKKIAAGHYEVSFDGDLPNRGTGILKPMDHAPGTPPEGFVVTVNTTNLEFRGTKASQLASVLKDSKSFFDFRKTRKRHDWSALDVNLGNRIVEPAASGRRD